ncbi:MAG: hypothetical protein H5U36_08395 [Candidatus Caldatribacterium sp.]|nr:hypothetical protein [Candidatus Caldatribacterium sp.]
MRKDLAEILEGMTKEELLEAFEYVASLIEEKEMEEPETRRAHVEVKMIGKYGPYAYLRWWENGKHRSKYLGKLRV